MTAEVTALFEIGIGKGSVSDHFNDTCLGACWQDATKITRLNSDNILFICIIMDLLSGF